MHILALIKGFGIGLAVAAVVGPIAIMTIRRTLAEGQAVGLAIALGASLADVVYALIAGLGLTFIADFLYEHELWIRLAGGLFLVYLGTKTLLEKPTQTSATIHAQGLLNTTIGTFFLNLTNPVTIASFTAIFAGFGIGTQAQYSALIFLVLGVFLGAMCWNLILTTVLSKFKSKIKVETLFYINKISGILLIFFGISSLLSIVVTQKIFPHVLEKYLNG